MCNPRRIRVRATRRLAEAWDQEVRRRVELTGQAVGQARVRERLGATVGGPTLSALTRILGRTPGWAEGEDGVFRHPLDGGVMAFDPEARTLEIIARVTAEVRASGEAVKIVRARAEDVLEMIGDGMYYDDGWGGLTEDSATREAREAAERSLDAAAASARDRERHRAEIREGDALRVSAQDRARAAMAAATSARERELDQQAGELLIEIGTEGRFLFHQVLAEAYRDAILAYARTRRATGIRCDEGPDGVLDIEFELDV
jgi:hypothetical protein